MVMFWVSLLAISILLYVVLDGIDLGVGLLFGLAKGEARRGAMLSAVAPIWDGNETWLVVTAVILWGAFPVVYATLLSAFYLPVIAMLLGLILRGVAFEFRYKTQRLRWIWDLSFAGGSVIATFIQGMTVGALVEGLQFTNGEYSGGDVGWLTPFAVLCGIAFASAMRFSAPAGWSESARPRFATSRAARSPYSRSACWRSSCLCSLTRWSNTFRSCIVGSIGPICSYSRRLARWRQRCSRSAS
jgi:cytochrome d oxidase subunit CydB